MWRILTILLVLAGSLRAETVKQLAKPTGYVSDYAGVLDADAKASIEAQCTALHQKTGTQIAVVTIHKLEGGTAAEFAQSLADAWGVGSKGTDKGVVMLFSIQDHKRWINVGYGLEGPLNDAKVGDIGRAMIPLLRQAKYGQGIGLGVGEVADAIEADPASSAGVQSLPAPVAAPPAKSHDADSSVGPIVFFWSLVIIVFIIVIGRRRAGSTQRNHGIPIVFGTPNTSPDSYSPTPSFSESSSVTSTSANDTFASDTPSNNSSSSDFGGFDGGSSGGGGAGGDW